MVFSNKEDLNFGGVPSFQFYLCLCTFPISYFSFPLLTHKAPNTHIIGLAMLCMDPN